jgi:hypothetical protein
MEDLYSIHPGISRVGGASSEASVVAVGGPSPADLTELMKAQIASHPRYPSLLSAYIECRKVQDPSIDRFLGRVHAGNCAENERRGEIDASPFYGYVFMCAVFS